MKMLKDAAKLVVDKLYNKPVKVATSPLFTQPPALSALYGNTAVNLTQIPINTASANLVSYLAGLPVGMATPITNSGVPVDEAQMNGLFQFFSQYILWTQAGGLATWSQSIANAGGYNAGMKLWSSTLNRFLVSLVDNNVAQFQVDNVNWALSEALASELTPVGDYKYSEQKNNHAQGAGTWVICNGQSLSTLLFPQLFALIGYQYGGSGNNFNVPNITGQVMANANSNHSYSSFAGADLVTVVLPQHTHTATDSGHSHGVNDPGHSHGITDPQHTHTTNAVYTTGGSGYGTGGTSWQNATINKASTGISINTGKTGITNAQGNANITVAQTGTAGAQMTVTQPTFYTRNCFIYAM
jgi:microcystin-dependent protein